eukprot:TRINITY_DN10702_c0_g1_i1.p1 TRINITY_DN10702_c0_g1~~TRINITY_DN10702_c0_g1_i1.p1  ORF type:complete len:135 (-),score=41.09 TRINITY_DN10702_c0_g1_i1:80-460(-)
MRTSTILVLLCLCLVIAGSFAANQEQAGLGKKLKKAAKKVGKVVKKVAGPVVGFAFDKVKCAGCKAVLTKLSGGALHDPSKVLKVLTGFCGSTPFSSLCKKAFKPYANKIAKYSGTGGICKAVKLC